MTVANGLDVQEACHDDESMEDEVLLVHRECYGYMRLDE